jgi:CheY-like chemotaxis protein
MKVIVIDDDKTWVREIADTLRSEGYEPLIFHSVEEARRGLADLEEPVPVLLDHDFGPGEQGYELCRWLRENHPFGLLLPIIYLTGRETPDRFLYQQSENPFTHPTVYVSKGQLAADDGFLSRALKKYQDQFERVRLLFEQQSARQALLDLAQMDPDVIDAP